jgi:ribosomal protein S18 acetylase RimI-like enzyme
MSKVGSNLERLTGAEALDRAADLIEVYRASFSGPPWFEDDHAVAAFAERLTTDARRPGFVAVLAGQDGEPAGFGTAWPTLSPFPTGRSYDRVRHQLGGQAEARLTGALEVDELAVSPYARGRGLAARILGLLCDGAPDCWLLTAPNAHDAIRLYERLGWQRLTGPDADVVVYTRASISSERDKGTSGSKAG